MPLYALNKLIIYLISKIYYQFIQVSELVYGKDTYTVLITKHTKVPNLSLIFIIVLIIF